MDIKKYFLNKSKLIEKELLTVLPKENHHPAQLSRAMRYAVLSGGKRIRPIFVLSACEAVGGRIKDAMPAALAVELIHSYSLVHDDLPCMDNDSLRRGKPSCHAKFGELTALLAGDALLTLAFKVLCQRAPRGVLAKRIPEVIRWISEAAGYEGMVGGQALDMEFQEKEMDLPTIQFINANKSGALIAVSVRAGAYLGGGSAKEVDALDRYGKYVGLLFQVADDIMDNQGYVRVLGTQETRKEALKLLEKATHALSGIKPRAKILAAIADFVANQEKK